LKNKLSDETPLLERIEKNLLDLFEHFGFGDAKKVGFGY
jgi:hypothetical protein